MEEQRIYAVMWPTAFPLWLNIQWRLWRLDVQRPDREQERVLLNLVRRAANTRFGRDHDFAGIRSVADFQDRVPLRHFDDFWSAYWQAGYPRLTDCTWPGAIPFFATSSGTTTGVTKHIPCTREMLEANGRAVQDLLAFHLANRPISGILFGKSLMLGGSTDLREEAPGVYSGDLSGIEAHEVPWWGRPLIFPSRELALNPDWEEKIAKLAPLSLKEDIRAISGTPNWLLMFFAKLAEIRPAVRQRIVDYFPHLELLVHAGVDFKPYAARFAELLEGSHAELREIYAASEGFIAVADRGPGEGLRLLVDNGVFFEFVPAAELGSARPARHWLANIETGVDYAVVVSTCAGLWGYVIGDTVRFVDLDPPRLLVTGRTSYVLSAFGEHVIDEQIAESVAAAAHVIGAAVVDYCVTPIFPKRKGQAGHHHYAVEFAEGRIRGKRLDRFCRAVDERLQALNADYGEFREHDYGLALPTVSTVAQGGFAAWMKSRGKLGGQNKVPRVITDPMLFDNLTSFLSEAYPQPRKSAVERRG